MNKKKTSFQSVNKWNQKYLCRNWMYKSRKSLESLESPSTPECQEGVPSPVILSEEVIPMSFHVALKSPLGILSQTLIFFSLLKKCVQNIIHWPLLKLWNIFAFSCSVKWSAFIWHLYQHKIPMFAIFLMLPLRKRCLNFCKKKVRDVTGDNLMW